MGHNLNCERELTHTDIIYFTYSRLTDEEDGEPFAARFLFGRKIGNPFTKKGFAICCVSTCEELVCA